MSADAAIKKIEGWEDALQEVDLPGVRAIQSEISARSSGSSIRMNRMAVASGQFFRASPMQR